MKRFTLKDRVSKFLVLLLLSIAVFLTFALGAIIFQYQKSFQDEQAELWVNSFHDSIVSHLMESDYYSVKSHTKLIRSTNMFKFLTVYDSSNKVVAGFGPSTIHNNFKNIEIDKNGEKWGEIKYQYSYKNLLIRMMKIISIIAGTIIFLITIFTFFAHKNLERLFAPFTEFVQKVNKLNHELKNHDVKLPLNLDHHAEDFEDDTLNSMESQKISESISTLISTLQDHQRKVSHYQEALIKSEIDKTRMDTVVQTTQMLAHDIKKPFSMFSSFVQMVEICPKERLPSLTSKFLADFNNSIKYAEKMISDILNVRDNDQTLNRESIYLKEFVFDIIKEQVQFIGGNLETVKVEIPEEITISVDPYSIKRVIGNLVHNALEAINNNKGNIWFRVLSCDSEYVYLRIENSESFIDEENLNEIFSPFVTYKKANGTGLGLAIVDKYLKAHNCKIDATSWFDSNNIGHVAFDFSLPLVIGEENGKKKINNIKNIAKYINPKRLSSEINFSGDELKTTNILSQLSDKVKVFMLDDQEYYTNVFHSIAENSVVLNGKIECSVFHDYVEASEEIRKNQHHIYIIDYDLGENDRTGLTFCNELKKIHPESFVCMHSDLNLSYFLDKNKFENIDFILPKPITIQHLIKLIGNILDNQNKHLIEV